MTDARILWPAPGAYSMNHWGTIAGKLGAPVGALMPRPFLIGIRGVAPLEHETHETVARPVYDDTFVCLAHDFMLPPYVFKGATHAYQRFSKASPDIDHDGVGDVGTIVPGRYLLTLGEERPYPVFRVANADGGPVRSYRDCDHDGRYSPSEIASPSPATAILMHVGFDAPADSPHRSSIGCLTAGVEELRYLAAEAKRVTPHEIECVVVTAERLITMLRGEQAVRNA